MSFTDEQLGAELAALFAESDLPEGCMQRLLPLVGGTAGVAERRRVMAHAATCAVCSEVLLLVDDAPIVPSIPRRSRRAYAVGALALAVAASLALVVLWPTPDPAPVELVAKGAWRLHVGVERDGQRFRTTDGRRLVAGDRIGLFYDAGRPGFAAVFYVDDAGVTPLAPATGGAALAVGAGQGVALPAGAELGEADGCEFVVGLFSLEPLPMAEARAIVADMHARAVGCRLGDPPGGGIDVQIRQVPR